MFRNNYKNKTRIEAFREIKNSLNKANIKDGEIKAKLLLSKAFNCDIGDIFIYSDIFVTKDQGRFIEKRLKKIFKGIPFQYAVNSADFYGLDFYVDSHVLIPRFDTEFLVKEAISFLTPPKKDMLDICTGSGCIAISVKKILPYVNVTASDISAGALRVARKNAKRIIEGNHISFIKSDMFKNIKGKFDVITANPPYICEEDPAGLEADVADFEPEGALFGGKDGLSYYRIIAKEAKEHMKDTGVLIIEAGYGQKESINEIFAADYENVKWIKDFSNIDRVTVFSKKGSTK